jgi:hypothetical protein
MIAPPAAAAPERELQDLYARSKMLALAAGAALVLDSSLDGLETQAEQLLEDCLAAHSQVSAFRPQLSACVDTARELRRLLAEADRGAATEADVDRARASHRRLQREVWRVLPCEYVPCCASGHAHDKR